MAANTPYQIALLQALSEDRALASAMLFPHRHPDETPAFHVEIIDLWRSHHDRVLIEAFREGAKSTLSEEFLGIEAAFHNFEYAIVVGETFTKACQRLEAIKFELSTNMKLYSLFGAMPDKPWNESVITLKNGVRLEAMGWEQEFRGFKHHAARPDRAYLDDIENKESVRDTAAVDAGWRKLWTQLWPSLDIKKRRLRVTGTPLADDCIINRLKKDPTFVKGRFPLCDRDIDDPQAKSQWPGRIPIEKIRQMRDEYEANGLLREFNQEYMLVAAGTQGKPFTEDMIVTSEVGPGDWMPKKAIYDPARTVNTKKSDETGKVVVSRIGTRIYVWESDGNFWMPSEIIDDMFETSARHDDCEVAAEKNSLDEWLLQPIRSRMLDTGQLIDLLPVSAPQDRSKDSFILGLQPFFNSHDIVLVGGTAKHKKLVAQITNFPSGRKDVINALAYALRVFSGRPVYTEFGPVNIIDSWLTERSDTVALAIAARGTETAAALITLDGQRTVVLRDWLIASEIDTAVDVILRQCRAAFPHNQIAAYVSGDLWDQQQRTPLVSALRKRKVDIVRSPYVTMARGCLSVPMRTEQDGKRLFLVDRAARRTLNALADGYKFPIKNGNEVGKDPDQNASQLLAEAIECLTAQITAANNAASLPKDLYQGTNAQGVPYMTTLRR